MGNDDEFTFQVSSTPNLNLEKVESRTENTQERTIGSLSFTVTSNPPSKAAKTPKPRAKVPFEKGYSQMDWMKLTQTHPDLAGLKNRSNKRLISMNEVKQNQSDGSMWTVLKGRVYNVAPYMKFHPGDKYHAWVNADFLLEKCLVGILEESS